MRAEQAKSEKCSGEVEVDCHDMPCAMCQPGPELAWAKDTTRICKNSCFCAILDTYQGFFQANQSLAEIVLYRTRKVEPFEAQFKTEHLTAGHIFMFAGFANDWIQL